MVTIIDGIECVHVDTGKSPKKNIRSLYANIPLKWLNDLPGECGKAKMIAILWCYNALNKGGWFKLGNRICKDYEISPSQKNRILASLEKSGHIELKRMPGKAVQVKLVKPPGWK